MARTARNSSLDNRTGRLKLDRCKWHKATLEPGLALRYRSTTQGYGVWYARIVDAKGVAREPRIGVADDYADANGTSVLNWKQAQAEARRLAERDQRPPTPWATRLTATWLGLRSTGSPSRPLRRPSQRIFVRSLPRTPSLP